MNKYSRDIDRDSYFKCIYTAEIFEELEEAYELWERYPELNEFKILRELLQVFRKAVGDASGKELLSISPAGNNKNRARAFQLKLSSK
jgi:hypothetical protein